MLPARHRRAPRSERSHPALYRIVADRGEHAAQNNVGIAYRDGDGVDKDPTEAARWFRKSADQGFAPAEDNLAAAYRLPASGVPQDLPEALKLYRAAADQLDPIGLYNLGTMYEHGEGVPASITEAAKWYRSGAEQGDSTAQARIGNMYASGEGVPKDPVEAFAWLDLAFLPRLAKKPPGSEMKSSKRSRKSR